MGSNLENSDLEGRRILVVEDEVLLAMELEALYRKQGFHVIGPVSSVADALGRIDREGPDIASLDVNLRGMSSAPVAIRLRERGIPFVLLTGYGERIMQDPAFRGAVMLRKPYAMRDLIAALRSALE